MANNMLLCQSNGQRAKGQRAKGRTALCSVLFALALLFAPRHAAAQGPMTIEPIGSGWAATPEVKQTEVDHHAGTLVGGNAGWVADETFFFGGAGYWLVNGNSGRELGYGGFLMQWIVNGSKPVGFAAKMLIGGGTGTVTDTVINYVPVPGPRNDPRQPVPTVPVTQQVHSHTDFFVFEPGIDAHVRFSNWARLTAGGGYRFIGDYYGHYGYPYNGYHDNGRLQGWTATVGVTFGGGF